MSGDNDSSRFTIGSGSVYQGRNLGQIAGNVTNNYYYYTEQQETLAEAAIEIQQLLKQLEQSNPSASEAEKIDYVNDETTPSFKRRVIGALQASSNVAIEEFLDNPYLLVGKAIAYAYESGLDLVVRETPLDYPDLPENCTYIPEQIFDPNFPSDTSED
jgi:hypothetical protein